MIPKLFFDLVDLSGVNRISFLDVRVSEEQDFLGSLQEVSLARPLFSDLLLFSVDCGFLWMGFRGMSAKAARLLEGPRAVRAFENAVKVCRRKNLLDFFALCREISLML